MKSILKYISLIIILLGMTGCIIKKDSFDGIDVYTTTYTIEFLANELYGAHSKIRSIYPDGVNIPDYIITNKKINDFSKADLFIYNGMSNEKQIAANLINKNNRLTIIDVSQGFEIKNEIDELWISPSNCLMIAQNIKNGLKENVSNTSILDEIDKNYENLKILISGYDADLKLIAENASNKTIFVANKAFNFLSKYGFEVINVNENDEESSSTAKSRAIKAFSTKENRNLFILKGTDEDENIKSLVDSGAALNYINQMINLTDEERNNNTNYITFMDAFVEALKSEVY